ncbi:MAG: hypothetical protein ABIR81_09280 [Ginsengibacter sp.]
MKTKVSLLKTFGYFLAGLTFSACDKSIDPEDFKNRFKNQPGEDHR